MLTDFNILVCEFHLSGDVWNRNQGIYIVVVVDIVFSMLFVLL